MKRALAGLFGILIGSTTASAVSYTVTDQYVGSADNGYGDVVADLSSNIDYNLFNISKVVVDFGPSHSSDIDIKVYTGFSEAVKVSGSYTDKQGHVWGEQWGTYVLPTYGTKYGDLFLSTKGWHPVGDKPWSQDSAANSASQWNYVLDTDQKTLNYYAGGLGSAQYQLSENAPPKSGSGPFIVRNGQEVLRTQGGTSTPVTVKTDRVVQTMKDLDVATGSFNSDGYFIEYIIPRAALDLPHGGTLGFKWSMTCANDSIEGSVPIPAPEPTTMLLLGTGLLGMAHVGRRKLRR